MQNKLLLIDGNSIMNRAFFGIRELTNSEGLHTNGIYGFINMMTKTIDEEKATHLVVAFDLKAPTFRHIKYEAYKGTRKGMPEELAEQMPVLKELLKQMGIRYAEIPGYEADDILGSLAVQGASKGFGVTVLSGDRDMLQIASETIKISIPKTKGGVTVTEHYYAKDVETLYEVTPLEFIDIKGLMGDASDNIPGVPSIGEKTAIKLIKEFHSIENLYNHLDKMAPRIANVLQENKELALLSKELATICVTCDSKIEFDDCKLEEIYTEAAYHTIKRLEFKSFYERFNDSKKAVLINQEVSSKSIHCIQTVDEFKTLMENPKVAYYLSKEDQEVYLAFAFNEQEIYYTDTSIVAFEVIQETVLKMLSNTNQKKITLDLKEQLHQLDIELLVENQSILDLSLISYLINPNKENYNIDDLANEFLKTHFTSLEELVGKGKSTIQLKDLERTKMIDYFTGCAEILFKSAAIIEEQMKQEGLDEIYYQIELPLTFVLGHMENVGVLVNATKLQEYGEKLRIQLVEIEKKIFEYAGETFNINSPKQLGVVLFDHMGLPTEKKNQTKHSTAADVLEKLKKKHPIIEEILSFRQLSKLKSTYADGLFDYIQGDGRIHSSFNQKVAATGRISSTEPNLQNIPIRMEIGREIRKVFIPKPGCVFVDADYSQIELRLLAHLSQDEIFVEAFNKNLDIHTLTASQVFHVPFEQVTALQRRNAKAVNFGIVYGISAFGLSEDLSISRKEAADYIENYFAKYPKVKELLDRTVEEAKLTGQVKTMYNRVRKIPELSSSNFMQRSFGERIAMNTPIQGSAADIMKIAMIRVYKALKDKNLQSEIVLTVHDELVIETLLEEADQVKEIVISEMENAAKLLVPLTVDAHIGENWYEAK